MSTGSQAEASRAGSRGVGVVDEGLFVRDLDGHLIRYDNATREELDKEVTLEIDGQEVEVKKAVPATDELGNLKYDEDGEVIPRPTTIYDAVTQRYEEAREQRRAARFGIGRRRRRGKRVPANRPARRRTRSRCSATRRTWTRWLSVASASCNWPGSDGGRARSRLIDKLLPACQHRVEDEMIVNTIASPEPGRPAADRGRGEDAGRAAHGRPSESRARRSSRPGDCASWRRWPARFDVTGAAIREAGGRAAQGRLVAGHRRRPQRLHPLRPLRARLRRDQGEPRHRPDGQGLQGADRLRPRRAHGGLVVRGLRRVLRVLPHRGVDAQRD